MTFERRVLWATIGFLIGWILWGLVQQASTSPQVLGAVSTHESATR